VTQLIVTYCPHCGSDMISHWIGREKVFYTCNKCSFQWEEFAPSFVTKYSKSN